MLEPLNREDVRRVIEGRGCARRVPVMLHLWTNAGAFADPTDERRVQALLDQYPADARCITYCNIDNFKGKADDPEFRWVNYDKPANWDDLPIDARVPIVEWSQLDDILAVFPNPEYPGLWPKPAALDDRYRVAHWWYTLFERHWSLRGMENALTDYYFYPDETHRLFEALTRFYLRMIERAKQELNADAIYVTDDLGTQSGLFFSTDIFDQFYAPYYKRLIDRAHELGMHFWLHTCGNIEALVPRFIDLKLDVLHPIQKYSMDEVKTAATFGGQLCFWPGFDVQRIIPYGTPDEVRAEVRHVMDTFYRPDGRLMFTAGNGITGDTPIASLEALFDEAYSYGEQLMLARSGRA